MKCRGLAMSLPAIPTECHHPGKSEEMGNLGSPELKFLIGWEMETEAAEGTRPAESRTAHLGPKMG